VKTPVLGQDHPYDVTTHRPIASIATTAANKIEERKADLDALEAVLSPPPKPKGFGALLGALLPKGLQSVPQADNKQKPKIDRRDLETNLRAIAEIYADQRVEESEILPLRRAEQRLIPILSMQSALELLPKAIKKRLDEELFNPIRVLYEAASKHRNMLTTSVQERDSAAFYAKIASEPEYRTLDLGSLESGVNFAKRYGLGDLVRIERSRGPATLGVVVGWEKNGDLRVEVDSDGEVLFKTLSARELRRQNPLKIGDRFQFGGNVYWVSGVGAEGELSVVDQAGRGTDARDLASKIEQAITEKKSELFAARAQQPDDSTSRPMRITGRYQRIEEVGEGGDPGIIAGNRETRDTVYKLKSPILQAALHTDKGKNYSKDWNEDGALLLADARGRMYVGVFDQAGGIGKGDPTARGAASKIAAECLFEKAQVIARSGAGLDEAAIAYLEALHEAHRQVLDRGFREATTFVGAMIDGNEALIVNVGDSGAMLFGAGGAHVASTVEHGMGPFLFEGVGLTHEDEDDPSRPPKHDLYRWRVEPGQLLVLGSDGLLDAGLTKEEIGKIVSGAGDAFEATRLLRDLVKQRMGTEAAKADNLTIAVIQIRSPEA
jgi:serine/threonine protein phosphatase PrpC